MFKHSASIALMQPLNKPYLLPLVGYPRPMPDEDVRAVVAVNLQRLIDYAKDNRRPGADAKSLAAKAGVTPSTVGRWLKGDNAAQIDTLETVAKVYKLRAWQLLIPNLDPANPPAVAYTDAERRLYWRIKAAFQDLAQGEVDAETEEATSSGAGGAPDSRVSKESPRSRKRKS